MWSTYEMPSLLRKTRFFPPKNDQIVRFVWNEVKATSGRARAGQLLGLPTPRFTQLTSDSLRDKKSQWNQKKRICLPGVYFLCFFSLFYVLDVFICIVVTICSICFIFFVCLICSCFICFICCICFTYSIFLHFIHRTLVFWDLSTASNKFGQSLEHQKRC